MQEVIEHIANFEMPAPHRVRLRGVDCPVERMLAGAVFRQKLPGYSVIMSPAFPVLHLLPKPASEDDDIPQESQVTVEHDLALPQHKLQNRDFVFFVMVVVCMALLYFPFPPLALNGAALALALAVYARFFPKNFYWQVRGLSLGWPTPLLLTWGAALMPLCMLPVHFMAGSVATHALDGAVILFIYQALRERQGQFMAAHFDAGDPGMREESLASISEFLAQFVLWLSLLLAGFAFTLWIFFPPVRLVAEWLNRVTLVQLGWNKGILLEGALQSAMAFLLVAPAAALLLITPALYAVCLRKASALNIFCESIGVLGALENVRLLALRKTGVLTEAQPMVKEIVTFGKYSEEEALALAAGLESCSSHPYAAAIHLHAQRKYIPITAAEEIEETLGLGIAGEVEGTRHFFGSEFYVKGLGVDTEGAHHAIYRMSRSGYVPLLLADNQKVLGVIALHDPLRKNSVRASNALQELEVTPVILSQGGRELTQTIAEQCAVPKFLSEYTEQGLAAALRQYQKERVGRTALFCLRNPHKKLRECADLVIGQRSDGEALGNMKADLEVGNGLDDVVKLFKLVRITRVARYQVIFVVLALLSLAYLVAFVGMLPAILAPFIPGFLLYYLHLRCEQLQRNDPFKSASKEIS